jgi:hypothetical protein
MQQNKSLPGNQVQAVFVRLYGRFTGVFRPLWAFV